ncbi:MAG TPA: response regulator, partial [Steroidobacteraceae bacterium]|nr:response regulator [Steroidobacteraceae bacterium]
MAARPPPPARMLVVEDDVRYAEWLRHHLDVLCPRASISMLNLVEFERWCTTFSGRDCDLLLLACRFGTRPEDPHSPGLALLRRLRDQPAAPAVIAIADDGNELTAVRALQLGALDYLPKKFLTPERLSTA